ncbi:MAG TPA: hypothetical protein VNE39_25830 [Planctomycetota bacterium]|nr:hypothetical protein [Planctomycetota bacterium]
MRTRGLGVLAAAVGLALLLVAVPTAVRAEDAKEAVPVDKLPAEITEAAAKLCPGGTITAAEKETDLDDKGQVVEFDYVLKVTLKSGKVHDVELDTTPEGKVKPSECEAKGPVAPEDLPATVVEAAKKLCPEGKLTSGERSAKFSGDQVEARYEIKIELAGGQTAGVSVNLAGDGTVKETSVEAPVALEEVPKGVVDALKLICPERSVVSAQKNTEARGDKVRVEFELKLRTADGKDCGAEVLLGDDGRIRRIEIKD